MPSRFARPLVTSLVAVLLGSGCGASSSANSGPNASVQAARDATTRLEGTWTLVEFQPDTALEPMLASFLAAQLGTLLVTFHQGVMSLEGPGVSTERNVRVSSAVADGFSLIITDPTNVEYRVDGAFHDAELNFTSLSDPWRGHGRLRRAR